MGSPSFYVACPLGDRTGGPEALALLVHSIRQRGFEAFLIPMYNFRGRRPHPEYDVFDYELADRMPKSDNAHLVLTEVSPIENYRELQQTPDENVWMLWLSVNFSPIPSARYFRADESCCSFLPPGSDTSALPTDLWPYDDVEITTGAARKLRESAKRKGGWSPGTAKSIAIERASIAYAERVVRRPINFGTQSYYGASYVRTVLGREAFLLTDYPRLPKIAPVPREKGLVVYNGSKGRWRLPSLQKELPDVTFVPIEKMSFDDVCELLSRASLYVELGHMPGRDRLPREAANYGTPTVMLARGAGYCRQDFPIGERYRIPYTTDWAARMAPVVQEVLDDPTEINAAQLPFREWVAGEKQRYDASLDAWIERIMARG